MVMHTTTKNFSIESDKNKMSSIAIVEDDQAIAQMYRIKFEAEGYSVQTADNGKAGLLLIETMKPDIVLLDIMMPEMNGDAVLETSGPYLGEGFESNYSHKYGRTRSTAQAKRTRRTSYCEGRDDTAVADLVKNIYQYENWFNWLGC